MRSSSFYDKLSELNDDLYNLPREYTGWKFITSYDDSTGLVIALYDIGNNETLFAIKGTDVLSIKDWFNNRSMALSKHLPKQFYHAEIYYNNIKDKYSNIVFTGYSLGGSIAQMLGTKYGNETVCFEPYGVGNIIKHHTENIINYGNAYDWVFMLDFVGQVGRVFLIPMKSDTGTCSFETHIPHKHGKPSDAQEFTGDRKAFKDSCVYLKDELANKVTSATNDIKNYVRGGIIHTKQNLVDQYAKFKQSTMPNIN